MRLTQDGARPRDSGQGREADCRLPSIRGVSPPVLRTERKADVLPCEGMNGGKAMYDIYAV